MKIYDTLIIGGGAAGMAAAVMCARKGLSAVIAEKLPRVGKKLLATGSGTCNISNMSVSPRNYHSLKGDGAAFVSPAINAFNTTAAAEFFESIGVETEVDERGRMYPLCRSAAAVLDSLRMAYMRDVEELTGFEVTEINRKNGVFSVTAADGRECMGKTVLMASGGAASPGLGGTARSYRLLESFGVTGTKQLPSVTAVKTDTSFIRAMKGLRVNARVDLRVNGKKTASSKDELLFVEGGLSGPAAFFVSRAVSMWENSGKGEMTAVINFLPDMPARELISKRRKLDRPADELLTGLFQKRIGQTLLRYSGVTLLDRRCSELSDSELEKIVCAVTSFTVKVNGTAGMKEAQVTAGGVNLSEVDPVTMELKKQRGIYCVGEMLDIDGDCGGYNLQWAWSSAYAAVQAISKREGMKK